MTIILWRRFTVRRLTQTSIKYIFSESLITADYEGIFINIKKLRFSKYSALFLKVQRFTNQVRFRSDLSGRTRLGSVEYAECGVRSVENAECGKCGVRKKCPIFNFSC